MRPRGAFAGGGVVRSPQCAPMNDVRHLPVASAGLVVGACLGMAGSFAPSAARGLCWGIDGTALVVACALLTVHHFRRGNDVVAAGFLVFAIAESIVVSGSAMDLAASTPTFGAGVALWAAALAMVSAPRVMPVLVRILGFVAALLFAVVAARIFLGHALTPLSEPLPFVAYPFLAATMFGWAWVHWLPVRAARAANAP